MTTFTGMSGTSAAQSTGLTPDHIFDFAAGTDTFDFGGIVGGFVNGDINFGASFNSNIGNAFSDGVNLHGDHAWVVLATGGTAVGHSFLVVDTNNNAHYDSGADFVIDITGYTGTISAADFI